MLTASVDNVFAQSPTVGGIIRREIRRDVRQDVRRDVRKIIGTNTPEIAGATVTAINGTSLTISKNGTVYTVNTDSSTKFARRYWGDTTLVEFSAGNIVNVQGTWADEAKTSINAKYIRNRSIMKKHGIFVGQVVSKNGTSFVIQSTGRGNQTVSFSSTTKFTGRLGRSMTYDQIKVGDKVEVKGIWDKSTNKIYSTTHVRDFNYPSRASTATPTTTP